MLSPVVTSDHMLVQEFFLSQLFLAQVWFWEFSIAIRWTPQVGGQCEIVVDFKPKELGPFHEARSLGDREATSVWFFGWMFNRCCYVFYWTPSSASSS